MNQPVPSAASQTIEACFGNLTSIKDAANKKPTYLAMLPSEVVQMKLAAYEAIWNSATLI